VVIVPGAGVLCIEAKSYVWRDADGMWHYGPHEPGVERSPFDQAGSTLWAIVKWLEKRGLPPVLSAIAVMVPDIDVRVDGIDDGASIEWLTWQLIDRSRYRSRSLAQHVLACLDAQRELLVTPPQPLTHEDAARIIRMLRAEVECYESPRARIEAAPAEAKRYTDEQFGVLDAFTGNERLLVNGLAGTGKTLLAIEIVRRAVGSGKRVLFACFNTMLGEWLAQETAPLGDACTACTVHAYMREVAGTLADPPAEDSAYWEEALPAAALDVLTGPAGAPPYDLVVLDEAQDVITFGAYLDVLDASLAGGLAGGRWVFFGDFAKQAIYRPLGGSPERVIARYIGYPPPVVRLDRNCRNTPRVAHAAGAIAGFREGEGYRATLREDDGREAAVLYYDGATTRTKQLLAALDLLRADGFNPGEIVVLSRRNAERSSAAGVDTTPWRDRLRPLAEAGGTHTGYDSIYRFKGREAPAVVLCDIDPLAEWREDSTEDDVRGLLYVGATRALSRVVIVAHEAWRSVLDFGPMDEFAVR
jgi:ATP:corrinoid adenosyltransferase